jgi:hypothetical protein
MFLGSIVAQYLLETLVFACLAFVTFLPAMKRREPRKVLLVLVALNMLRFGGVAGALAAVRGSAAPAFLVQVAAGDGIAASFAVAAFVLLLRKSDKAPRAVVAMNVLGLLGILVSETWLQCLELGGGLTRSTFLHGPTIGAAFYTAVHILVFYLVARSAVRTNLPLVPSPSARAA